MNTKTFKFTFLNLWLLLVLFFCKSSVDQPTTDYNLLSLFNVKVLNGFYWEGLGELSGCTVISADPSPCWIYQENYRNFIRTKEKNLYVYIDSLQASGKITLEIANPDTFSYLKIELPVSLSVTIGPETGNGYGRIINLYNPSTITVDEINITLNSFTADVLEDGLRGSMNIKLISQNNSTNNLNLSFSFNIKKIL